MELIFIFLGIPSFALIVWIIVSVNKPVNINYGRTFAEEKGRIGESNVAGALKALDSSYRVINDIVLYDRKGISAQIDHIVFSPYGIYVIETKNYSGFIIGYGDAKNWTQTFYGHRQEKLLNPILQNKKHIYVLNYILRKKENIHNVIVFSGNADVFYDDPIYSGVVLHISELMTYLNSDRNRIFAQEEVNEMYEKIMDVGEQGEEAKREHVASIHKRRERKKEQIEKRVCPFCNGDLVDRSGKYGSFIGCSNFPKCRFKS